MNWCFVHWPLWLYEWYKLQDTLNVQFWQMPIIDSCCLCFGATPCQIMEVPNCHNFRVGVNNEWGDNYCCILCIVNCMPTARSWERQQRPVSFNHGRGHTLHANSSITTNMNLHNFKVYLQVKSQSSLRPVHDVDNGKYFFTS